MNIRTTTKHVDRHSSLYCKFSLSFFYSGQWAFGRTNALHFFSFLFGVTVTVSSLLSSKVWTEQVTYNKYNCFPWSLPYYKEKLWNHKSTFHQVPVIFELHECYLKPNAIQFSVFTISHDFKSELKLIYSSYVIEWG